jgi:hypothetical protein
MADCLTFKWGLVSGHDYADMKTLYDPFRACRERSEGGRDEKKAALMEQLFYLPDVKIPILLLPPQYKP